MENDGIAYMSRYTARNRCHFGHSFVVGHCWGSVVRRASPEVRSRKIIIIPLEIIARTGPIYSHATSPNRSNCVSRVTERDAKPYSVRRHLQTVSYGIIEHENGVIRRLFSATTLM